MECVLISHFLAGNTLGAVTQVSDILALNGISIFYLSTFDDDFILVSCNARAAIFGNLNS